MKNQLCRTAAFLLPLALTAAGLSACSTVRGEKQASQELTETGPNVVNVRSNPDVVSLNRNYQPSGPAEVLAEVKDFTSPIQDVKLRFTNIPLEIPMQHVAGTTYRAELTPQQLKALAVGGQTMTYDANVIARNSKGQIAMSKQPVQVAVKAPDLKTETG